MYLRVNQPFGLVYDHYLRPRTYVLGHVKINYKSTTQPSVGLCELYLRPRIYILGHAKKSNNTQHYVLCVVLRLTQQAHKLQPFGLQRNIAIAHHNRPKGRLWYVYHNLSGYGTRFKIIRWGLDCCNKHDTMHYNINTCCK